MIEEENIEDQSADDSPQSTDENNAVELQTTNHQLQTEEMEVHKHPHHVTHKKKWGEYLLEFFMLFLAVFLGFVAENIRENIVEKEKSTQYLQSFYEDLKRDTVNFSKVIAFNDDKLASFSNIYSCYDTLRKNWQSTSCLLQMVKKSRTNITVTFSNATTQQLKNAGGYRMLSKQDRDSIMGYDNSIESFKNFESTFFQESQDIVRSTFSMIGDFRANKFLFPALSGADSSHIETTLLFSDDKAMLNKYFNDLFRYKVAIAGHNNQIKQRKIKAINLLKYFNDKYHF
ncbi:MAG: hypothetical protein M3004_04460 [Bacteroidota bacterium]|nr:hypothetical protein [Bacteroidota bacterium]